MTTRQRHSKTAARLTAVVLLGLGIAGCTSDDGGQDDTDGASGPLETEGVEGTGGTDGTTGSESTTTTEGTVETSGTGTSTTGTDGTSGGGGSETGEPIEPELEVRVQGASLVGGANGMFFDGDDRLHVASVGGQRISVLDRDSGEGIDTLSADQGVAFPDDLTFAPDGTMYWTEFAFGEVRGLTADGTSVSVASGISSVNPITVSDDGRLFVAQCFDPVSNGIYELDPAGVEAPRLILGGIPGCASNGLDWQGGFLYAPQWFNGRVVRVDVETGELTEVTTDWPVPAAVKFDSNGALHAVSYGSGEVVRIDLETGVRTVLAELPIGLDNLAFDSDDRLFVSSATDAFIVEVEDDGTVTELRTGGMNTAMGVAVLGDQLWVGEALAMRSFDKASGEELGVVRNVLGVGPFGSSPGNVTALDDARLLLLDPFSGGAAIFDSTSMAVQPIEPLVVPADAEPFGTGIAVSDFATGQIVLASGPSLSQREVLVEDLTGPTGLAADGDNLYVSSLATGLVLQVVEDGGVLDVPVPVTDVVFAGPEGIAIRDGGRLVVVEGGTGALRQVELSTGSVTTLATELSFLPPLPGLLPFQFLNDVVVDDDDVLYVNGDGEGVVYGLSTAGAG